MHHHNSSATICEYNHDLNIKGDVGETEKQRVKVQGKKADRRVRPRTRCKAYEYTKVLRSKVVKYTL